MEPDLSQSAADSPSFRFEGRGIPIRHGATVAAALVAAGELSLRETRQGDHRGVFCGMGVCQECLVSIDGRPGQRACMTAADPGMAVSRQPALPRLTERPAAGTQDMRAAGELTRRCDLLVVGGGPGGLTAAAIAAEAGLDVVLIDERAKLGGQYFKQPPGGPSASGPPPDAQFAAGRALIDRVAAAGVDTRTRTAVWGAFAPDDIAAISPAARWRFVAQCLILAPGAFERGVPLPGWTLPGVMTTGAAQTLWRSYGTAPGRRVLLSGNGPLNMQVAAELTRSGATVVGLAEVARPGSPARLPSLARMALADRGLIRDGAGYRRALARARVPVMYASSVVRIEGEDRARVAVVMRVGADGRPRPGTERSFEVDAVCLGFGFIPSTEIARALGCRHEHSAAAGHLITAVDDRGATSRERVWVVGDGAGIGGARLAQTQGELAGLDAARALGAQIAPELLARERESQANGARHQRFQTALGQVFRAPRLQAQLADTATIVCRCEGVTLGQVERALCAELGDVGAVKRVTRAGMGPCQGRYCGPVIAEMAAISTGRALHEFSGFAPSPPIKPVEIGALIDAPWDSERPCARLGPSRLRGEGRHV
jgi:NADPH-dependent 2,4-dienoyl-CoA reductase/sulfur reductase-like enzyme